MPQRIDQIVYEVTIDDVDVSDYVERLRVKHSLSLRCSEAVVEMVALPEGVNYRQPMVISAGLVSTGSDTSGLVQRFDGYVYEFKYDLWRETYTVEGRGPLILAELTLAPDDGEAASIQNPDPLAEPSEWDPPGIDMSVNPDTLAEWTDAEMITWGLQQCGLGDRIGFIGGLPYKLGVLAFEKFVWERGQSFASFIEKLDLIGLGHRTHERIDGLIYRTLTGPFAPFEDTARTIIEGTHLFEGSNLTRTARFVRNRVVVEGYDMGAGPEVAVEIRPHPAPWPGVPFETEYIRSPMIEKTEPADFDEGLSCREVANQKADELKHVYLEASIPTWDDYPYSPGDVVYLNSPRMEVNQAMWCREVEISVEPDSFTQVLGLRAAAFWEGRGVRATFGTESAAIPHRLEINP